jgi:hypothetical protein
MDHLHGIEMKDQGRRTKAFFETIRPSSFINQNMAIQTAAQPSSRADADQNNVITAAVAQRSL